MNDPALPVWADAIETLVVWASRSRPAPTWSSTSCMPASSEIPGPLLRLRAAAVCCCAAQGDLDGSLQAFERGLAELEAYPYPLERGRTLLCLGTVRRQAQQKKAAREALEQALAIFEELGARLWAEKARGELRRVSGRRGASEELTETELRVAALAAQGQTNKEIAAELFMGVSTVEMHLSRVYRKLGVRRAELGAALAMAQGEAATNMDEAAQT